ncbi:TlpA family protein disulfide reductase [Dysgonomonas sp. ZJ279]|uniref:TlpA family protein disulfide reductase n=1 Tax=Dysgonomonas sp. ZJ279 TaxID=2709796 RepID=UPI0013EBB6CB|nr:TlpA disulfide reductase family protein [Dysgonomonas sp. ZJ279]
MKKPISVVLLFVLFILQIDAQQGDDIINIKLNTPQYYEETEGGLIFIPNPIKIWPENDLVAPFDSILYELVLQDDLQFRKSTDIGQKICEDMPDGLKILLRKESDSIIIKLSKHYNYFLKNDIRLSYHADSAKKWTNKILPDNLFPRIDIIYPYCLENKIEYKTCELFFLPFVDGVTFNDSRFYELPLNVFISKMRNAKFQNNTISIIKNNLANSDIVGLELNVIDSLGNYHGDAYVNGIKYKRNYRLNDSIYINNQYYKLTEINENWDNVQLQLLTDINEKTPLLANILLDKLNPFFTEKKKFIVIDFWGTWCSPCIATLPKLRELYNLYNDRYEFVSVCFDRADNFDKAKTIFEENDIQWPQIFDESNNESITVKLGITTFPTYMLIDHKGQILLKNGGLPGFENLANYMKK